MINKKFSRIPRVATGQATQPTRLQEPKAPRPLYKPLSSMCYDEFHDDIEITYNGTKIIQAERPPRHRLLYVCFGPCPHRGWFSHETRPPTEAKATPVVSR